MIYYILSRENTVKSLDGTFQFLPSFGHFQQCNQPTPSRKIVAAAVFGRLGLETCLWKCCCRFCCKRCHRSDTHYHHRPCQPNSLDLLVAVVVDGSVLQIHSNVKRALITDTFYNTYTLLKLG